jgi:hypothetical protein
MDSASFRLVIGVRREKGVGQSKSGKGGICLGSDNENTYKDDG